HDLAASTAHCTLAIWHHPRFSSGEHGDDPQTAPFWTMLYAAGAELIVNGHDHDYERFAPQDPSGKEVRPTGIRELVVGTGGGGTSVAYHLAERGWTDVILVDRAELTSGSTFHSAGLVGQLRGSVTLTTMMMYGTALYRRLRDETGVDPSWHEVGSLRLASSKARLGEW